jgi:hypothetical protein
MVGDPEKEDDKNNNAKDRKEKNSVANNKKSNAPPPAAALPPPPALPPPANNANAVDSDDDVAQDDSKVKVFSHTTHQDAITMSCLNNVFIPKFSLNICAVLGGPSGLFLALGILLAVLSCACFVGWELRKQNDEWRNEEEDDEEDGVNGTPGGGGRRGGERRQLLPPQKSPAFVMPKFMTGGSSPNAMAKLRGAMERGEPSSASSRGQQQQQQRGRSATKTATKSSPRWFSRNLGLTMDYINRRSSPSQSPVLDKNAYQFKQVSGSYGSTGAGGGGGKLPARKSGSFNDLTAASGGVVLDSAFHFKNGSTTSAGSAGSSGSGGVSSSSGSNTSPTSGGPLIVFNATAADGGRSDEELVRAGSRSPGRRLSPGGSQRRALTSRSSSATGRRRSGNKTSVIPLAWAGKGLMAGKILDTTD